MTLDGDWTCDQEKLDGCGECFAVWEHCECVATKVPDDIDPSYNGGLVPAGEGLKIDDCQGNLWFDRADEFRGRFDICATCTGSGGGYYCGVHDAAQ